MGLSDLFLTKEGVWWCFLFLNWTLLALLTLPSLTPPSFTTLFISKPQNACRKEKINAKMKRSTSRSLFLPFSREATNAETTLGCHCLYNLWCAYVLLWGAVGNALKPGWVTFPPSLWQRLSFVFLTPSSRGFLLRKIKLWLRDDSLSSHKLLDGRGRPGGADEIFKTKTCLTS